MKKLILACAAVAILGVFPAAHAGVQGCSVAGDSGSCDYVADQAGNIVAAGDSWTVEVWWGGTCGADGTGDWIRSAANDHNNAGGVAGTWEGSMATGSCARASISSPGIVAIGSVTAP